MRSGFGWAALAVAVLGGCGSDPEARPRGDGGAGDAAPGGAEAGSPEGGYRSELYADAASWLCLPGSDRDACTRDLDATVLSADGTLRPEPFVADADAAIDCFYVYPTISTDTSANSDLSPDDAEWDVVREQAARLSSVCRVFAPVYRQVTLASLFGTTFDTPVEERREIAYADVLDAYRHYLSVHNGGRGVVLVGHSQGASILRRLVAEHVETDPPSRDRIVSALLIGGNFAVPDGADVGRDFQQIPLCRSPADVGCVVAYSAFRSDVPPDPANTLFGRPRTGGGVAACTHPAALAGGAAPLDAYFPVRDGLVTLAGLPPLDTPFVRMPGLLSGECVERDGLRYLEVRIAADAADPRPDDIPGDLTTGWGLHLVDVHLGMGDLVTLVGAQARAWASR
ncbi:MAG: DUF3089 domain-containing protein [Deltaproteobacteria bacterium]|nr:DUF3089 domain-containing protein [Deltaproteobacteria bacterium]